MTVAVGAAHGFGARLNNRARLRDVRLDGAPVEHAFGGGVLWVPAPRSARAELVLTYELDASREPASRRDGAGPSGGGGAAAGAAPAYGAYHNTDVWHPFFDYLSANDLAQIAATVRLPAEYHLTTTVPQVDTVRAGVRQVSARSVHPSILLALIYDRDWRPQATDFGTFRFESFTTPDFRHPHDSLAAVTKRVYDVLAPRFGEPQHPSRYLAAVQSRALGPGGFSVRMNNAAVSGAGGGATLDSPSSQAFAHETGHAWTMNATGRAANFLREAWGTYVEALVYRAFHGPAVERAFWERQRSAYETGLDRQGFAGGFEGHQSILGSYDNGRIHYRKGVWVLHAASHVMGDSAFARGMRWYVDGMGKGRSGHEELIAAWTRAAGRDMTPFVMPWLTSRHTPDVDARVEDGRLILTQRQPGELFELPRLEVELATGSGPVRRTVHLARRADTLDVRDLGAVTRVHVDPDHRFLLRRHLGEPAVRFELPVAKVPTAGSVALMGNFLRAPIPATRVGEAWVVELPMTEGQYVWLWQVDGATAGAGSDPALTGTRDVRPLQRVTNAYPGR